MPQRSQELLYNAPTRDSPHHVPAGWGSVAVAASPTGQRAAREPMAASAARSLASPISPERVDEASAGPRGCASPDIVLCSPAPTPCEGSTLRNGKRALPRKWRSTPAIVPEAGRDAGTRRGRVPMFNCHPQADSPRRGRGRLRRACGDGGLRLTAGVAAAESSVQQLSAERQIYAAATHSRVHAD